MRIKRIQFGWNAFKIATIYPKKLVAVLWWQHILWFCQSWLVFFLFKFDLNWFRSFNYVVVVSCRRSVQNLIGIDVTRPRNQFTKRNTRIINQKYTSVPFLSVYHLRDFFYNVFFIKLSIWNFFFGFLYFVFRSFARMNFVSVFHINDSFSFWLSICLSVVITIQ